MLRWGWGGFTGKWLGLPGRWRVDLDGIGVMRRGKGETHNPPFEKSEYINGARRNHCQGDE